MINRVVLKDLYDMYSYDVTIRKGQNVFILTGPNGYGKTTILRSINNLLSCNFWYFYYLLFKEIEISFDDDTRFVIKKLSSNNDNSISDSTTLDENVESMVQVLYYNKRELIEVFSIDNQYIFNIVRARGRKTQYFRPFQSDEDYIRHNYDLTYDRDLNKMAKQAILYLSGYRCSFIEEQRLFEKVDSDGTIRPTITVVNESFGHEYRNALNNYARVCQRVDGTFIKRLSLFTKAPNNLDKGIIQQKFEDLRNRISRYQKYNLVQELEVVSDLDDKYNDVLSLYLDDLTEKLNTLESIFHKLELFEKFVTNKQLSNKHIEVGDSGFTIYSDTGRIIPVQKLSSGEQNLIILAYRLIFETQQNDILLIDEPENSLHIAWLKGLLEDYRKIAKMKDLQVIVATHSPAFINGQWKLTYDLCEDGTTSEVH